MKLSTKNVIVKNLVRKFIALVTILSFSACEQTPLYEDYPEDNLALSTYEVSEMSQIDFDILFKALNQLDIKEGNDNLYDIRKNSGSNVKVSDNLFNFIKTNFDYTNKLRKQNRSPFSPNFSFPRLKRSTPENGQTGGTPTDCMAHSIAFMAGKPLPTVKSFLEGTYGSDGVPYDSFEAACRAFEPQGIYSEYASLLPTGNLQKAVIVINGGSHAVNAIYNNGNYVLYEDKQAAFYTGTPTTGVILVSGVKKWFMPNL